MEDNAAKSTYLLNVFCDNEYEREEMRNWINSKGIEVVYDFVDEYFNDSEEDIT